MAKNKHRASDNATSSNPGKIRGKQIHRQGEMSRRGNRYSRALCKGIAVRTESELGFSAISMEEHSTQNISDFSDEGYADYTLATACDPKDFKRTLMQLSLKRLNQIEEMGFGSLHKFRCKKLHIPLCQMLVERFDTDNSMINIHGRNLYITHTDMQRVMGLRDGGVTVDLSGSLDDGHVAELKTMLCSNDGDITVDLVRKRVLDDETADDMFKISFCLYALTIMFSPTTPGYVDHRLLILSRDPNDLQYKDWAKFAFGRLVEGVALFRQGLPYLGGCLLFLQLFYLDSLVCSFFTVSKRIPPVMAWGTAESNRIISKIKDNGGFYANTVPVTKRLGCGKLSEFSESCDVSTGLKPIRMDDLREVKLEVSSVKEHVDKLTSRVTEIRPDVESLRCAVTTLEKSVNEFSAGAIEAFILEVMKQLVPNLSYLSNSRIDNLQEHEGAQSPDDMDAEMVGFNDEDKMVGNCITESWKTLLTSEHLYNREHVVYFGR